ncbi:hypothetical protein Cma02nite_29030 [Cellulomonas marina]|uniref:Uncharacterized protein n=1 Tax=Cellulomonas marina TaxID=988821 RepID=A0A1I1A117_9CELL|nr:hypothetical protein Cma02nite_29030 [Cellulomonas marina]SFB31517.1 hypothetical protein SAMN05421867_11427 [Cellulomonas marina]
MRRATFIFLAGLLASMAPLPWPAVGVLLVIASIVLAVRAARTGRAQGGSARSPFATSAVVLVVVATLWTVASSSTLLLWPVRQQLQDCQERAVTVTAQQRCTQAYQDRLEEMGLRGTPTP